MKVCLIICAFVLPVISAAPNSWENLEPNSEKVNFSEIFVDRLTYPVLNFIRTYATWSESSFELNPFTSSEKLASSFDLMTTLLKEWNKMSEFWVKMQAFTMLQENCLQTKDSAQNCDNEAVEKMRNDLIEDFEVYKVALEPIIESFFTSVEESNVEYDDGTDEGLDGGLKVKDPINEIMTAK